MWLTLALLAARKSHDVFYPTTYPNSVIEEITEANIHPGEICENGNLYAFPTSIRWVVGVTCILSMIGSLLIVLSYFLIPAIRTKAREILVNLSLMDFMVATANLVGILTDYANDIPMHNATDPGIVTEKNLCIAQASFAMYGTISSVLWTICIAVYVFLRIMLEGSKLGQKCVYAFYVLCYGLPLVMTIWYSTTGKLGFDHYGGSGWCSLKLYDQHGALPFNAIFGNDIWIYLTMILVPLLFISLHFYIRHNVRVGRTILSHNLSSAVQTVERKLILIPVIFILLRVWSLLLVLLKVEIGFTLNCTTILFLLHIGGIGDSGQGLANAILFVLFTPKVRRYFFIRPCVLCCRPLRDRLTPLSTSHPDTSRYGSIASNLKPNDDFSAATQSDTSGIDEQDTKSLLVNA